MSLRSKPLLGVSGHWGDPEVALARRFDELHQLLYRRGGIHPTNAAVEELAKLLFLRLWLQREPRLLLSNGTPLSALFDEPEKLPGLVNQFKVAFRDSLSNPALHTHTPDGEPHPVWPTDEPFRLASADVLVEAVNVVSTLMATDEKSISDPLGTAFDALLSGRYDHSGGLGTYLTPSAVARSMVEIALSLSDQSEWTDKLPVVGDPYCGTGRFLVAALEAAREGYFGEHDYYQEFLANGLVGFDQSVSAVAKARINLMLYGARAPKIWRVEDSVTSNSTQPLHNSLDIILTNPPFGEQKYDNPSGINSTVRAIPKLATKERIDPALACLVKSLRLLAPGGVLGIVLPEGIVEGRAFDDLLHSETGDLAGQIGVEANVSLPKATFSLSGTVAKTNAVFIRKLPQPQRCILARVEHVGFTKQAGKAAADPDGNELPEIVSSVRGALQEASSTEALQVVNESPLVASADVRSLDTLSPSRLDPCALASRRELAGSGGSHLRSVLAANRVPRATSRDGRPFVSVLHVDELGAVDWHAAENHNPVTPGVVAESGSILLSLLNPSKLRATVVPDKYAEVVCSSEFGIFKSNCNPWAVLALLQDERVRAQLRPLGKGTSSSRRRISEEDVLSLTIPSLVDSELEALGKEVECAVEAIRISRQQLTELYNWE